MMTSTLRTRPATTASFLRADDMLITVTGIVSPARIGTYMDPPEPAEVDDLTATDEAGNTVELTEAETEEAIEALCLQNAEDIAEAMAERAERAADCARDNRLMGDR